MKVTVIFDKQPLVICFNAFISGRIIYPSKKVVHNLVLFFSVLVLLAYFMGTTFDGM